MAVSWVCGVERFWWTGSVTACRPFPVVGVWLSNDVLACPGLAVAWLKRGASGHEVPGIRRARHGSREPVLDIQPKLSARVRLLATGDTNKNDPNDARSVAIAALRPASRRVAAADDQAAV